MHLNPNSPPLLATQCGVGHRAMDADSGDLGWIRPWSWKFMGVGRTGKAIP